MFIRNCWYVIAWDHEVSAEGLFTRTVLGEPILLYRRANGTLVAMEDRCCHRLAPLSKGRHEGDHVRCGYHGLRFDPNGICVEVPGLEKVPPNTRVRTYPLAVKNKWVFVWMGDAQLADTGLLPDNFSCDDPQWRYLPGYMHYDTSYLLITDNLLDFSHLSFVHESTLGGSVEIAQARPVIEKIPRGIKVSRRVPNVPAPGFYKKFLTYKGNLDRWFIYDFVLPGTLLMSSGGRPAGQSESDSSNTVRLHSCQTLTPETENTTHYFFQQSFPADKAEDSIVQGIYDSLIVAFNEDRDTIRSQARNIAMSPNSKMQPLAMDSALMQFRRLVDEALAAER